MLSLDRISQFLFENMRFQDRIFSRDLLLEKCLTKKKRKLLDMSSEQTLNMPLTTASQGENSLKSLKVPILIPVLPNAIIILLSLRQLRNISPKEIQFLNYIKSIPTLSNSSYPEPIGLTALSWAGVVQIECSRARIPGFKSLSHYCFPL